MLIMKKSVSGEFFSAFFLYTLWTFLLKNKKQGEQPCFDLWLVFQFYYLTGIVRRFFGNFYIVIVAFTNACISYTDKLSLSKFLQVGNTTVAHTRTESSYVLVNDFTYASHVGHLSFNSFRHI